MDKTGQLKKQRNLGDSHDEQASSEVDEAVMLIVNISCLISR